jgi:hypothetical protein
MPIRRQNSWGAIEHQTTSTQRLDSGLNLANIFKRFPGGLVMVFRDLMKFLIGIYEEKNLDYSYQGPNIVARLRYIDNQGIVTFKYADLGFSTGLKPELTVEMNTIRDTREWL